MIKCFAATNSFWIDPQGHIRPCARFQDKFDHVTEFQTFSEITRSKKHTEIKESLERGVWPEGCIRCKTDEEKGVRSKRSFYERVGLKAPDDFMVDISMGNFCNLKCRMCKPNNSTLWYNDYNYLVEQGIVKASSEDLSAYHLSERDIEKLIAHLRSVKGEIYIELKGGEPLIMPQTKKLVDHILKLDNVSKITLAMVTNGTVIPSWLENLSAKNKKLFLIVSVDGLDEVYNYIRGIEKFNYKDCLENIRRFKEIPNLELNFNVVVQNLNIHQMVDIHVELSKFSRSINYITLQFPAHLAANVMPSPAREKIYGDFLKRSKEFGNHEALMTNIFNTLKTEPDPRLLEKFYKFSAALDQRRGQDLFAVLPHFR